MIDTLEPAEPLKNIVQGLVSNAIHRELIGFNVLKLPAAQKMLQMELKTAMEEAGVTTNTNSRFEIHEVPISPMSLLRGQLKIYFLIRADNFSKNGNNVSFGCTVNITPAGDSVSAVSLSDVRTFDPKAVERDRSDED